MNSYEIHIESGTINRKTGCRTYVKYVKAKTRASATAKAKSYGWKVDMVFLAAENV